MLSVSRGGQLLAGLDVRGPDAPFDVVGPGEGSVSAGRTAPDAAGTGGAPGDRVPVRSTPPGRTAGRRVTRMVVMTREQSVVETRGRRGVP